MSGRQAWEVQLLDERVEAELDAWPTPVRAALDKIVERIETLGLDRLHEPHVKHVEGKIWEMRPDARGMEGRALYITTAGRRVVILCAFTKRTRKTPRRWIETALERARGLA